VVAFAIHAKRSAAGLLALLGGKSQGILCSDRWGVYAQVPAARRQICWAHLKRDSKRSSTAAARVRTWGDRGKSWSKRSLPSGTSFQEGQVTRAELAAKLAPVEKRMNYVLLDGALLGEDPTWRGFVRTCWSLEAALWTFVTRRGGADEQSHGAFVAAAVLWRKRSFGSWSQAGCRFVERILTVVQTRRLQAKNVLDYLHDALRAHRFGQTPAPRCSRKGERLPVFNLCVLEGAKYKDVDLSIAFKASRARATRAAARCGATRTPQLLHRAHEPAEDNFRLYKVVGGKRCSCSPRTRPRPR